MDQKLQDHWKNLIRPLFQDVAYFAVRVLGKNFEVEVSWIINTDPSRPNKPSKTLRIIFPWETIIDYQEKTEQEQKSADGKIIKFIKSNLENFAPNHDNPRNMIAPEVQWIVRTDVI
jgi:hypothetical protein